MNVYKRSVIFDCYLDFKENFRILLLLEISKNRSQGHILGRWFASYINESALVIIFLVHNYHVITCLVSIPIKEQCVFVCLSVGLLFIGHTTFVHFAALPPSTPRAAKPSRAAPLARASVGTARARARMPYNFSTKKSLR